MWHRTVKIITTLGSIGIVISAVASVLMTLGITGSTILRYGFNRPPYFIEEYSGYVMVAMTFLGLAYTLRSGGHVAIEYVPMRLSKKGRGLLELVTGSISLVMLCILLRYSWKLCLNSLNNNLRSNTVMLTPLWIPQMFVVVGLFIFGLELMVEMVSKVIAARRLSSMPGSKSG